MEINIGSIVLEDELNFGNIKLDTVKVYPELENLEVNPSKEEQIYKSQDYYGYDEVKVNKVTNSIDENIKPENIRKDVSILGVTGNVEEINTTEISVNPISEEQVITPEEPYNGFSKVTVGAQSGINPAEYFNGNFTSVNTTGEVSGGWRHVLKKLPNITIPSNATSLRYFFAGFKGAEIPYIDTSNISNISNIFQYCLNFERVPKLDGSKFTDLRGAFGSYLDKLFNFTDFGGFKDLGKAYLTNASANYSNYTLDLRACVSLTHESLMNVINNLYDIASIGVQPQILQLGSTLKAKLTSDEISIAQNKGWNVL